MDIFFIRKKNEGLSRVRAKWMRRWNGVLLTKALKANI